MPKQESNFLKVKCVVCGKTLVEPKGGRSKIYAQIVEVLDH